MESMNMNSYDILDIISIFLNERGNSFRNSKLYTYINGDLKPITKIKVLWPDGTLRWEFKASSILALEYECSYIKDWHSYFVAIADEHEIPIKGITTETVYEKTVYYDNVIIR